MLVPLVRAATAAVMHARSGTLISVGVRFASRFGREGAQTHDTALAVDSLMGSDDVQTQSRDRLGGSRNGASIASARAGASEGIT
jgi:hypothetical protein